jgi:hypothetical protein
MLLSPQGTGKSQLEQVKKSRGGGPKEMALLQAGFNSR